MKNKITVRRILKELVKGFREYCLVVPLCVYKIRYSLFLKGNESAYSSLLSKEDFDSMFHHLFNENKRRRILGGTRVVYPGYRSINGIDSDAIEGCTRFLPLTAAFSETLLDDSIFKLEARTNIKSVITLGCNPDSICYWGHPKECTQIVCEMADIALTLWLSRDWLWSELTEVEKTNVISWLKKGIDQPVPSNNWHLFIIQIELVLCCFCEDIEVSQWRFNDVKSYKRESGWFQDGPCGDIDLYSAWGFNYSFYWITQIAPEFEPEFINQSIKEFGDSYIHLLDESGSIPLFGRSSCYRLAIPSPLLASSFLDLGSVSRGQAARALKRTWSYFIAKGAIKNGRITQGVFRDNESILDGYSGPASPMWSLRSLILAYHQVGKQDSPFDILEDPLPIETEDYKVTLGEKGMVAIGSKNTGLVTLVRSKANSGSKHERRWVRLLKFLLQLRPCRAPVYVDKGSLVVVSDNRSIDD